ncbi:DUF5009 domain-containing protein [Chitinophaga silvatica]|uniref:DUF5009 domain-containing protein n=1 Tax=Chitinophaga silvatica TaxID=2282649 RepID=A0A3E1YAV3_9BACT|nr:DUF5009 domain-containing protein [Chitinophaga silvatica]RFS23026.1 DUF5009 domain-containing protein [Chitinophaga silvatica]
MINNLKSGRILSIDAFRGITILVMVFVNNVSGVSGVPSWMLHAHQNEDRMTFVDVVFPAFLFIVGMSIPFGINARLAKGDGWWKLQGHIIWRTIGLITLGIFMANTEYVDAAATGMSMAVWSLLFYCCAILVWQAYRIKQVWITYTLRAIGIIGLVYLGVIFRGTDSTSKYLAPHWWGILGLIGWAYLYACIIYQLFKGRAGGIMLMIIVCVVGYTLLQKLDHPGTGWIRLQSRNLTHTAIVLSGLLVSLFYFDEDIDLKGRRLFSRITGYLILLITAAFLLRPAFEISKNRATPSWALYSAAISVVIYSFLHWLIETKQINKWVSYIQPVASNPLLTYLLPDIVFYALMLAGITLPAILMEGTTGIIWSACFSVLMLFLVKGLNKLGIRLQL